MAENKEPQDVQEQEIDKEFDIEIEDDTPEEDRGRNPLPQEMVKELEEDELEDYSDKVKTRLKQMKKVWHDERREKERALREHQEAVALAQKVLEENKTLKSKLTEGEKSLVLTATSAAELEMEMAKRAYKEAYEAGDSDKVLEAQEKLNNASYRLQRLKGYTPPPQAPEAPSLQSNNSSDINVNTQQTQAPRLDPKTENWRKQNTWFGQDEEMTATALGLHQKLVKQYGEGIVGSDDYWQRVDETMRKRYPDYFDDETVEVDTKPAQRTEKPATVVAPATRSTGAKKVRLKQSQLDLVKKLGITPEQYAREFLKTTGV